MNTAIWHCVLARHGAVMALAAVTVSLACKSTSDAVPLPGPSASTTQAATAGGAGSPSSQSAGAALFAANCAGCHGPLSELSHGQLPMQTLLLGASQSTIDLACQEQPAMSGVCAGLGASGRMAIAQVMTPLATSTAVASSGSPTSDGGATTPAAPPSPPVSFGQVTSGVQTIINAASSAQDGDPSVLTGGILNGLMQVFAGLGTGGSSGSAGAQE